MTISGTGFDVWAVCGLTPVGLEHLLGVAVVGRHETDAAPAGDRLDDGAEARVGRLDGLDRPPGSTPVWPTMSGLAKFTTAKP